MSRVHKPESTWQLLAVLTCQKTQVCIAFIVSNSRMFLSSMAPVLSHTNCDAARASLPPVQIAKIRLNICDIFHK